MNRLEIEDTLLKCPLCGSGVTLLEHGVECDVCLLTLHRETTTKRQSDEELAGAWNSRRVDNRLANNESNYGDKV